MTRAEVPVVRKQVVVNAPAEQAFMAFTERFGDFKPPEHNLLAAAGWPLYLARYAALIEGRG